MIAASNRSTCPGLGGPLIGRKVGGATSAPVAVGASDRAWSQAETKITKDRTRRGWGSVRLFANNARRHGTTARVPLDPAEYISGSKCMGPPASWAQRG